MEPLTLADELSATASDGCVVIAGELHHDNAQALLTWLATAGPVTRLVLDELDIADGVAATQAVNAVRFLLSVHPSLCIHGAPQSLAHNLYRTGLLETGEIRLEAMREDEAYG